MTDHHPINSLNHHGPKHTDSDKCAHTFNRAHARAEECVVIINGAGFRCDGFWCAGFRGAGRRHAKVDGFIIGKRLHWLHHGPALCVATVAGVNHFRPIVNVVDAHFFLGSEPPYQLVVLRVIDAGGRETVTGFDLFPALFCFVLLCFRVVFFLSRYLVIYVNSVICSL